MERLFVSPLLSSPLTWIASGALLGVVALLGFRWLRRCRARDMVFDLDPYTILNKRHAKGFLTLREYEEMRRRVASYSAAIVSLDDTSREKALFCLKRYANGDLREEDLLKEPILQNLRRES